jgi:hypothetical protein
MNMLRLSAWLTFLLSIALWGLFGYLVWQLYGERVEYVAAATAAQEAELRGESASRLRATIHDTEVERASLDGLLDIGILRAVEVLETTGRQAGATEVTIGEATPMPLTAAPAGLTSVSIVVNMQGSFSALIRALSLYETLTIPSILEQFEMEEVGSAWRATARVRVYHTAK